MGEQKPSPFIEHLLEAKEFDYHACDLFPRSAEVIACDMNDLSPLFGRIRADVVCLFRSSYFIRNKHDFFDQIKKIMAPGGYLFMDFLIGSSDLPVLDFRYGDVQAAFAYDKDHPAFFQTSFYDDRLVQEFADDVEPFCRHSRRWPLSTRISYLRKAGRYYLRDVGALKDLTSANLGEQLHALLPQENVFSLADFRADGFEIIAFGAKYFYPLVRKFNLYCFVGARLGT
ncbi:MAG: hypothetical protein WD751_02325 [Anaerolineales bacterium]